MLDWNCVEPANRAFRELTGLTTAYTGYGTEGEAFISGYDPKAGEYRLAFKDEHGKWYDTRNTADWPVFDKLFGRREMWELFCSAMGDCARRAIQAGID